MTTYARRDSRHRISQVGRYSIFGQIAAGGSVMLHLARFSGPAGFARMVAVKRLHPRLAEDPELRAAFLAEARQISHVRHRNVVPTLDIVVSDNEVLQVLEHIHGATLGTLRNAAQRQQQDIPLSVCAAIMIGALQGLHAAHEARGESGEALNIVHGGVTPAQVLVGADGVPMVFGFGDARALRDHPEVNPSVPGEPTYLAPEQMRGEPVTRATDIFAASVVLWELLTARWLFGGVAEHERRYRLLQGAELTPPSTIAARIPRGLDDIIMKGLRANPADRYRTALEMAAAIERAVPAASQPVVAEWVTQTARDALDQQIQMLKEIEASPSDAQPLRVAELDDAVAEPTLAPPATARRLNPPIDVGHTMAPRVVARPAPPPGSDRRALVIGILGATIFAGLLAATHHAMRAGAFQRAPPPMTPAGSPSALGTTVILRNDPATGGVATGSVIAASHAAPSSERVVAAADAGVIAEPHTAVAPARSPEPDDAPAPAPVLSRDTTLDPRAAEAAARALLRDRRPAPRAPSSKSGARHKPAASMEAAPAPAADDEPTEELPADQ